MEVLRAVVWRNLNDPGSEYCRLCRTGAGFELEGHVVVALSAVPFYVHYQVRCDPRWKTQAVRMDVSRGGEARRLRISAGDNRHWIFGDEEVEAVRGCDDVDLAFTPATNTLPIRRLGLSVGESLDITAAWLRFPELTLEPLPQRYTRIAESSYRYESNGFTTQLEVDDLGLIVSYARGWQREAAFSVLPSPIRD
jgi:uncharacterized protein